ncbi:heme exporter protein CcmD [Rhodoferax sp. UBA5149]|uniref:heme exporter protein CcmD n=1 Tax=Rhodoferax sp. UBA5149 TaxID=1947379 RepID=UPI0025FF53EF|nr:heme exporter protein CcmD [Rhodoferax sp. UBA5149]
MQWNSASEFFAMGGYAFYVWGSFGVTAVVVVIEMLLIRSQRRELLRDLRNELMSERTSP